jgi:hypothetical protein
MENQQKNARPWDIFNKNFEKVSDEIYKTRIDLCLECEHLVKKVNQCKKCGCFMSVKAKLPHAECPVGKWNQERVSFKEENNDR